MKQACTPSSGELVTLTVRVTRETADALKAVADRNYRPVAAHMRLLIESDIAGQTPVQKAAA
jgi:predicted DNA-binding protein